MAANNASSSSAATTLNAAASAISSADPRYPTPERQRRWKISCWSGLSCFGSQKRGKRIVPSRLPDGNTVANRANGAQPAGGANQPTGLTPSLLAPPSSPASFTNSANPSSVQSPNGFLSLSANVCSPGGPTSTMFATGPYAHETQLVSPPVFSTFTTEPSTAPLTPPPELAHLTTPSSPDVPFAQLLASSVDVKTANKENGVTFSCSPYTTSGYVATNDLQAAYQLYPGSPASQLVSPKPGVSSSGSSLHDLEFPPHWNASLSGQDTFFPKYEPSKFFNLDAVASRSFMLSQDSGRSTRSPELCLDQIEQTCHFGGKQFSSQETDVYYGNGGNMQQTRYTEPNKPDVEQLEAYRASFGFSADEVTTSNREVTEVLGDNNLEISPFGSQKSYSGEFTAFDKRNMRAEMETESIALFDSGNAALLRNHEENSIEAQSIEDTTNAKDDWYSEGTQANSASKTKNYTEANGSESFSRFGEFKFDKKDGLDGSSSIIEKWTRYKEKRTAENGVRNHEFFHMKQPQEEVKGGTLS